MGHSILYVVLLFEEGCICGFCIGGFFWKSVVSVCKFYELYLYVWVKLKRWSAIVWNSLNTKYVRFKLGITVAAWLIA